MMMKNIDNANGFTLIEVMITAFILAVGILAMSAMQINAIDASSSSFSRSSATLIAENLLEELKRLPFDDANLDGTAGADLDAGAAVGSGAPNPAVAAHRYDPVNFSAANSALSLSGSDVVGHTGQVYQIFWNVDKTPVVIGTDSFTPFCTIRLFVYWDTRMGRNHLAMTTIKYNNTGV
jgi:type IV pilus assembly protein PilV